MGKMAKGTLALQDDMRKAWAAIAATQKEIRDLAAAQKRTETALKAFLESRRGSNGHRKRKIDLQ